MVEMVRFVEVDEVVRVVGVVEVIRVVRMVEVVGVRQVHRPNRAFEIVDFKASLWSTQKPLDLDQLQTIFY